MDRPGKLLESERRLLSDRRTQIHVSAVSIWELRLKHKARHASGERKNRFSPDDVLAALGKQEVMFLPMTMRHAARNLNTPIDHRDPFDEMLLVQAQEEGLRLLTVDRRLGGHPLAITSGDLD